MLEPLPATATTTGQVPQYPPHQVYKAGLGNLFTFCASLYSSLGHETLTKALL